MKSKHPYLRALALSGLFLLSGCGEEAVSPSSSPTVRLSFIDNPYCTYSQKTLIVNRGDDAAITLRFQSGFSFSSCDYPSYLSQEDGGGEIRLTLKNVRFPQQIRVAEETAENGIAYHANGGKFLADAFTGDVAVKWYDLSHHLRANTERGIDLFEREGYLLSGWNTAADGTGEHYGLGSRITLSKNALRNLYAEWVKESPASLFQSVVKDDGCHLSLYQGEKQVKDLVIPSKISGQKVVAIERGFIQGVQGERLLIAPSVERIASYAFSACSFTSLFFSDSLATIYGDSFATSSFSAWHLNAALAPRYQKDNDNAAFADDMDRLILHQDDKKLLLYGGCSLSYGLKSALLAKTYADYTVLDMGVIGGTNAAFAFDCMAPYVKKNDVFVHAPEVASAYQLMADVSAEYRMFVEVEGNYDLLSLVDLSSIPSLFKIFGEFQQGRLLLPPVSYEDYLEHYDSYGDIAIVRPSTGQDAKYSTDGEYRYHAEYGSESALDALSGCYQKLSKRGCTVYFSFSPVNRSGLSSASVLTTSWLTFETTYQTGLGKRGYSVISKAENYLYLGRLFYDTDYHLNDEGAFLRTSQLASDLAPYL